MNVSSRKLASLGMSYAVRDFALDGTPHVVAATEDHGPVFLISPPDWSVSEIVDGPGGTMAVVPVSADGRRLAAIMGCFPGYKFHGSGLYQFELQGDKSAHWTSTRMADLPFAHRLEVVSLGGEGAVVAANIAETKDNPEDWDKPGTVWQAPVDAPQWKLEPILEHLHKNHGMYRTSYHGHPSLLISGVEGLFDLPIPGASDQAWKPQMIMPREISEIGLIDIDGDGTDELVTIEPFHGHLLRVYKEEQGAWQLRQEHEISFGHGLWTGKLFGRPGILVGSRSGDKSLKYLAPKSAGSTELSVEILDEGKAPANIAVINNGSEELLFVTNPGAEEIALYTVGE